MAFINHSIPKSSQEFLLGALLIDNYCPSALCIMHFGFREIAAAISGAALIFCCSCEKHHLGEAPEVQKEHVDEPKGGEENVAEPNQADVVESATPKPTPAEFFPENTPAP